MILRNVAVRHGRRTLALPLSRAGLRQLSTETNTARTSDSASPTPIDGQPGTSPALASGFVSVKKKKQQHGSVEQNISLSSDSAHEHSTLNWSRPHRLGKSGDVLTPAQQYKEFERVQIATKKMGSRVERRYVPTELIRNPPGPQDVTLELLMASQTHMGHNTSLWNPANSKYIYGVRQGIHIISLETTAAHLRRAARVVEEVSYRGGIVLFVGTRKGQMEIVTRAAEMSGACHLFTKWTPGSITNRDVIYAMQPTKVVDQMDQELEDFGRYLSSARPLVPDLVVCLNPLENYVMLYECGLKNVPTIGVIDTNTDPSWVTYTIPANDDSLRAMAVIGGVLGRAGQAGQQRRLKDSAAGNIPWSNSNEIDRHMYREIRDVIEKRKKVMGRMQDKVQGFTEEEQRLLNSQFSGAESSMSQAEMLEAMGEAVSQEALKEMGVAPETSPNQASSKEGTILAQLGEVEAQLDSVSEMARAVESSLGDQESKE